MTGTDAESHTQEGREQQLVDAVIASLASTPDQRLKTVLTALVEHLHAFIREVRLTEREWQQGIDFLTRVGHMTDDQRQEFILLSDVLGASMQMIIVNDDATAVTSRRFSITSLRRSDQLLRFENPGELFCRLRHKLDHVAHSY